MTPEQAVALVRPAADALSCGDVERALTLAPASRCKLEDIQRVLKDHPVALRRLTDVDYDRAIVDVFENDQTGECGFYVLLDLVAQDGGYGDLSLMMIVLTEDGASKVGIDDLSTL